MGGTSPASAFAEEQERPRHDRPSPELRIPVKMIKITTLILLIAVLFIAIGLAALRSPSPIWASTLFTAALLLPLIAILKSIACKAGDRLPWIGIALFGLSSLAVGFRLPPSALNVASSMHPPDTLFAELMTAMSYVINPDIYNYIQSEYPEWPGAVSAPINSRADCYFICCNSLGSLFLGLVGGMLGRWFAASSRGGIVGAGRSG